MRTTNLKLSLIAALLTATATYAQENELRWTMDSAIKQLDRQGSDMETVLSDVTIEYGGAKENLDAVKRGRMYLNRDGKFRLNGTDPQGITVLLEGRTVHYYNETLARVDEYRLSDHEDRLEPFVPLGFSTTGKDLERDYLVTFIGEDHIEGRRVLGLELTPKDDDLRAIVSKVQIYVDEASWLPARQVITQGSDTLTITYSGTARNLNLNPDLFRDDWPRGTQKIRK